MTAHGHTRKRAFDAACRLAASGQRPSVTSVRSALGGAGGQQAIQQGLQDWMDEAARRFQVPGIPDPLHGPMVALWDASCRISDERWATQKGALEGRIATLEGELDQFREALMSREDALARLTAEHSAQAHELSRTQDALDGARIELEARTSELSQLRNELGRLSMEAGEQSSRRAHAERVAGEARASLENAQERIAEMRGALDVARARAELLERSEADARRVAQQTRSDLESAQAEISELRRTMSERDGQIGALTATLQTEQQARDADTQHWLTRLSEHQAAVLDIKAREAELIEEKKELTLEVRRLGQDLRLSAQRNLQNRGDQKVDLDAQGQCE